MDYPLKGIRILDLSRVWSGPLAGRILADLGAEVINVVGRSTIPLREVTPEVAAILGVFPDNDPGERPYDRTSLGNDLGRNKLGLTLELNMEEGIEIFKRLVGKSDVVLENYSPRVMPNFGLDYDQLKKINPKIIMCSMPGYGQTGPYRDWVSYGTNLDPAAGLASLMGYRGGSAHMSGNAYPDPVAALHTASALLTALFVCRRTGKGQNIDLAQSESASFLIGDAILGYALNNKVPEMMGSRDARYAPQGCYPCLGDDKWVTISVSGQDEWLTLIEALGQPAWGEDAKFKDHASRYENHDFLDEHLSAWTSTQTHYDVMNLLQAAGISAAAVLNAPELISDPHLNQRGYFIDVDHPETGPLKHTSLPIRFSKIPVPPNRPAPSLGQHNYKVLSEILGYSDEEIKAFEEAGVIGTEPLD